MSGIEMKYFVLKPKGENIYAEASRKALIAYAETIEDENPEMAQALIEWSSREEENSKKEEIEIDISKESLFSLMEMAHEKNITLNEFCNEVLRNHIDSLEDNT